MKFKLVEEISIEDSFVKNLIERNHTKHLSTGNVSVADGLITKVKEYIGIHSAFEDVEQEIESTRNYSSVLCGLMNIKDEYNIHHLDFNNQNNSWNNLVLIPAEVHKQIHKEILYQVLQSLGLKLNSSDAIQQLKNIDSKKLVAALIDASLDLIQSNVGNQLFRLSDIVNRIRK